MLTADSPSMRAVDTLVDLRVTPERAAAIRADSQHWVPWDLSRRQLCDLGLLATGAYSPLTGFMTRRDYEPVCSRMRLASGALWPIPITLDVPEDVASHANVGDVVALRDPEGVTLAALTVEDVWRADLVVEAEALYGTSRREHPGVAALFHETHPWRIGGRVEALQLPAHYAFARLRRSPAALRAEFAARGWTRVLAFQPAGPMHRAERDLTLRAARDLDASLLIHPVVGMPPPGDPDFYMRVRCYEKVLAAYPPGFADLSLLPLATRLAGPRETLWQAIVRKNYGCTHLLIDHNDGTARGDGSSQPLHDWRAAQDLVARHAPEIGIEMVPSRQMVFVPEAGGYVPEDEAPPGQSTPSLPPSELRSRLAADRDIPGWFSFPAIIDEMRRAHPPRSRQGFTVFFTGLSGSGKSTIANALLVRLMECAGRPVTLLDGDIVRKHLSSELGFSKEHRDLNIRRIGYVASQITKAGAIAICCPIAPYERVRGEVRALIEPSGGFVLVYVATPLDVCEQRDRKGLYAKARAGAIAHFTGVSDPYEAPRDAEIAIDTTATTPEGAVDLIVAHLCHQGYLLDVDEDPMRNEPA